MKSIGIITITLITLILLQIWRGYALSKLWLWFIASTFGASPLSIVQSIGLSLFVSLLSYQYNSYEDKEKSAKERFTQSVVFAIIAPAMSLLIGWIVKGFLG